MNSSRVLPPQSVAIWNKRKIPTKKAVFLVETNNLQVLIISISAKNSAKTWRIYAPSLPFAINCPRA